MSNFAKLFQINIMNQVLLTIRFDSTLKKDVVTQYTQIAGFDLAVDVAFPKEDDANIAFDSYDQQKADTFYNEMAAFIEKGSQNTPPDESVAV